MTSWAGIANWFPKNLAEQASTPPPLASQGQEAATSLLDLQKDPSLSPIGNGSQFQVKAPSISIPDFGNLPSIQSFVPQIREAGGLKLQSGLSALRSQYGKQDEDLQSQLAASGTYDSGDSAKLQNRMFSTRGQEETQLISNIQAETLTQEVSEMQRQGQISEERARMIIDYSFQAAMKNGDYQQAAAIHNADMNMEIQKYNSNIIGLKADLVAKGNDALVKWAEVEVAKSEAEAKQRGLDIEENKVNVAQYHEAILACGQYSDGVDQCLSDAKNDYLASLSTGNMQQAAGDALSAQGQQQTPNTGGMEGYTGGNVPIGGSIGVGQLMHTSAYAQLNTPGQTTIDYNGARYRIERNSMNVPRTLVRIS